MWIMIIILMTHAPTITQVNGFKSKGACVHAAKKVKSVNEIYARPIVNTICINLEHKQAEADE